MPVKIIQSEHHQYNLFDRPTRDICEANHGGNRFSREAYESIKTNIHAQRVFFLDYIRFQGKEGATADEIRIAFDIKTSSHSARTSDLKKAGLLFDSGDRRKTKTGCWASVLVTKEYL